MPRSSVFNLETSHLAGEHCRGRGPHGWPEEGSGRSPSPTQELSRAGLWCTAGCGSPKSPRSGAPKDSLPSRQCVDAAVSMGCSSSGIYTQVSILHVPTSLSAIKCANQEATALLRAWSGSREPWHMVGPMGRIAGICPNPHAASVSLSWALKTIQHQRFKQTAMFPKNQPYPHVKISLPNPFFSLAFNMAKSYALQSKSASASHSPHSPSPGCCT